MIDHFLLSTLVAPAALVVSMAALVDRQHPAQAAVAFVSSAVVVAAASSVSVAAVSIHALLVLIQGDLPEWPYWTALAFLAIAVASFAGGARRERRSLCAAREQAAALPGGDVVVVVAEERPAAFTLPGRPGRIVVTQGMLDALGEESHAVVMAHEHAHLSGHHHRWLLASRLAVAAHPFLWQVRHLVGYMIERWADERAAEQTGDRRATARAIGEAALLSPDGEVPFGAVPFSGLRGPGPVPRRIAALLKPLPSPRGAFLLAVPVLVAAGSVVWTGEAIVDLTQPGGPCER
ncbi:M56 family metallopeptidase [Streptosporangium sp. NBC_01810]|uniref:M56 family metallopeptidase n=1 Tax=Streptosporangium sp. NBC_01810 TaxID=2975951 RepID=UPI002DD8782F|nr:M56 family metallopeptidase [Streptosporangium sp. NBC_01810]WSA28506.1 M56 family metallopeptidase [Streptosporangium sp. NBC_01810]